MFAIGIACVLSIVLFYSSGRVTISSYQFTASEAGLPKVSSSDASGLGDPHDGDLVLSRSSNPIPRRDPAIHKDKQPLNHGDASGFAFATLLCTRNASVYDPYFAATQFLVYTQLWSKTPSRYPFIVLVCPFTPQDQRDVLQGQGAVVIELSLINDIVPYRELAVPRWVDQFSKLNIWNLTQYKKIAFLDSDVFPISNIDDYFEIVEDHQCDRTLLEKEKRSLYWQDASETELDEMCSYSFGAVEWYVSQSINGGMFVMSPNALMHKRLLELAHHREAFDSTRMEQGLLNIAFHTKGPFPAQYLDITMNPPDPWLIPPENFARARVVHQKIWVTIIADQSPQLKHMWDLGWMEMCRFYDSDEFAEARESGRRKSKLEVYTDNLIKMENEKSIERQQEST